MNCGVRIEFSRKPTIHNQEMEFKASYIKEALKEPVNIGGLLVAGAAAAYAATTGFLVGPAMVLASALIAEGAYLVTVPASASTAASWIAARAI